MLLLGSTHTVELAFNLYKNNMNYKILIHLFWLSKIVNVEKGENKK